MGIVQNACPKAQSSEFIGLDVLGLITLLC